MTEHQRETAFLRRLITFDDTDERHKLEQSMGEVQREERCVKRIAWLMVLLGGVGLAGLAYGTLFAERFSYGESRWVWEALCILGLTSLISLAGMACFLIVYRHKLNRLREECRRLVTRLLESRLGTPQFGRWKAAEGGVGLNGVEKTERMEKADSEPDRTRH